jgi:hypothetical protein
VGESWETLLVFESTQEPASLLAGGLHLLESHVGAKIGHDMEPASGTYADLHDGPAHAQAGPTGLLQDVEVAFPLAGKATVGSANDVEVDTRSSWVSGLTGHG